MNLRFNFTCRYTDHSRCPLPGLWCNVLTCVQLCVDKLLGMQLESCTISMNDYKNVYLAPN